MIVLKAAKIACRGAKREGQRQGPAKSASPGLVHEVFRPKVVSNGPKLRGSDCNVEHDMLNALCELCRKLAIVCLLLDMLLLSYPKPQNDRPPLED